MGIVRIEGFDKPFKIKGRLPDEEESEAIRNTISDFHATQQPTLANLESPPVAEPTGVASNISETEARRRGIREKVESLPGLAEFLLEMTPATIGTAVGAAGGMAIGGPPGAILGGMAGGFLGETIGQVTGVAPESDFAIGASGIAPGVGAAGGLALKGAKRTGAFAVQAIAPARAAAAKSAEIAASGELQSLASKILLKQRGLQSIPSDTLFKIARQEGVSFTPEQLKNTRTALDALDKEASKLSFFPEGQQLISLIDSTTATLSQGGFSFDSFISTRQLIGSAIKRSQNAGGPKLGGTKQLFAAMSDDLDALAKTGGYKGRLAIVSQQASKRAKLEFSLDEFKGAISDAMENIPGSGELKINIQKIEKWFRKVTDPDHANFNKNFNDSMKDEIPAIRKRLNDLAKETAESGSAAGRGSIVVRGITGTAGGAILGTIMSPLGVVGAGIGGTVGGLIGASAPDAMMAILMHPRAANLLKKVMNAGKGTVDVKKWENIGQFVNQLAIQPE
jgi:hypothetical protein